MNNSRKDWISAQLGEFFNIQTGNTPRKANPQNYGEDIPFIKPPDISNSIISTASEYLSMQGAECARILEPNSVLITCIGYLGRVGITKSVVAFNQQINAITPNRFVIPKYTFYYAQSQEFINELISMSTSTTVALVNKSNFSKIELALPPLPIQRAIVARIEELFSSLDQGIADLKRAQAQLKIYRQAVLKKAFEGKLTKVPMTKGVNIGSVTEINPKLENKNLINGDFEVQFVPMKLVEEVNNKIHLNEVRTFGEIQGKAIRISQMVM